MARIYRGQDLVGSIKRNTKLQCESIALDESTRVIRVHRVMFAKASTVGIVKSAARRFLVRYFDFRAILPVERVATKGGSYRYSCLCDHVIAEVEVKRTWVSIFNCL